jgi:hypothetical protein
MIAVLVIGHPRPASAEVRMSGDFRPAAVRACVEKLHESTGRAPIVVATWSPVVVDATIRLWRDVWPLHGDGIYRRILLRGPRVDTPLTWAKEPTWLARFSIGDLLARGEFDPWLMPGSDPDESPLEAMISEAPATAAGEAPSAIRALICRTRSLYQAERDVEAWHRDAVAAAARIQEVL